MPPTVCGMTPDTNDCRRGRMLCVSLDQAPRVLGLGSGEMINATVTPGAQPTSLGEDTERSRALSEASGSPWVLSEGKEQTLIYILGSHLHFTQALALTFSTRLLHN